MSISAESLPAESLRAAVLKALAKKVEKYIKDGKAGLKPLMDALKIDALSAELPDGTEVAKVRRAGGNTSAQVTDEVKFTRYVEKNRPGEIVRAVRESYQKSLLELMTKNGDLVDPETGEVVPGVGFVTGTSYLTVNFEDRGEELIEQAWREHRISLDSLLALPAGGDADG